MLRFRGDVYVYVEIKDAGLKDRRANVAMMLKFSSAGSMGFDRELSIRNTAASASRAL